MTLRLPWPVHSVPQPQLVQDVQHTVQSTSEGFFLTFPSDSSAQDLQ